MPELRMIVIASIAGNDESLYEETLVPFETGDEVEAATKAGEWLHALASGLIEEAKS